jgi:hypothetical protein
MMVPEASCSSLEQKLHGPSVGSKNIQQQHPEVWKQETSSKRVAWRQNKTHSLERKRACSTKLVPTSSEFISNSPAHLMSCDACVEMLLLAALRIACEMKQTVGAGKSLFWSRGVTYLADTNNSAVIVYENDRLTSLFSSTVIGPVCKMKGAAR